MSNYNSLKATINANIKANGNEEITGYVLNSVLNEMVNLLGVGYQYMGIATPDSPNTNQTPDYNCFYISNTPGTYSHLGGLVVFDDEICLLVYNGTWSKQDLGIATDGKVGKFAREVYEKFGSTHVPTTDEAIVVPFLINRSSNTWAGVNTSTGSRSWFVEAGKVIVLTANLTYDSAWAFLANSPANVQEGQGAVYADAVGLRILKSGETTIAVAPSDCYLYVQYRQLSQNVSVFPSYRAIVTKWTEYDQLKTDVQGLLEDRVILSSGNNLFDWRKGKMGVVSTTGGIQDSSSYWMTDFIPINKSTLFVSGGTPFRVSLFNQNKGFLRTISGTALRSVMDVSGAAYVIISFALTSVALEDAPNIFVNYACGSDVRTTTKSIDGKRMSCKDPQFFTIADILQFASNEDEQKFTQGFSLSIGKGNLGNKNMIITSDAMYTTGQSGDMPTVKFIYAYRLNYSVVYESQSFVLGSRDFYEEKQWRLPKFPDFCSLRIEVNIPSGVSLYVKSFENSFDNTINRNCPAYIFDGHRNQNTLKGFERVAMLGFPSCITIPKRTSDGVWVCFHDEVIGSQLVDANGNSPGSVGIWDLTFAQLQTYTYKEDYAGNKAQVPTLEEFFLICARTGMRPMLSVHPTPTASEYQEIKDLAIRCGVLKQLELKPLVTGEGVAFATFGNEISAYILQANTISASTAISRLNALGADTTKVRVGAEFFGDSAGLTEQGVADIVDAGYVVSIYSKDFSADQYKYWMSKGVTEFTDDGNSSYGLNW